MMKCNSCSPLTGLRNCGNHATLFCPTCRKLGIDKKLSAFCGQKCFRRSWPEHKLLHQAAKKSIRLDDDDTREPICESDSTHQEILQLSKELTAAKEQLNGQGRHFMDYQNIIQNLTSEVANLRDEAKNDFLAASQEEQESQDAYQELADKMKVLEGEFQLKLDLAESEAEAAVKLLKTRDQEIEKYRQDASEQLEKSRSTWQAQCEKLGTETAALHSAVRDKEILLEQKNEQHQADLQNTEVSTRQATEEKCKKETSAALSKANDEATALLQRSLQEQDVSVRQVCKTEEMAALHALQEKLKAESRSVAQARADEHRQSCEDLSTRLEAEKDAALAAQRNTLTCEHDAAVIALTSTHDDKLRRAAEQLTLAQSDAAQRVASLSAAHQEEVTALSASYTALEHRMAGIEAQHCEAMSTALSACRREGEVQLKQAVQDTRDELQRVVDGALADREEYLQLYTKESKARKAIHNKLMDIQGNIRVMCRVRPVLDMERKQAKGEDVDATEILSEEDIVINRDKFTKSRFEFDKVFSPGGTQEAVFDAIQPLIVSVLDGFNVCIFAYGQTGSGKTFTMEGYGDGPEERGVSPRAIDDLFAIIEKNENWAYSVKFSMLEIYNETIRDLLVEPVGGGGKATEVVKLDIRQTSSGNVVTGLTEREVAGGEEVRELMSRGQRNRAVGAHDMNEHSSRSHSILTLTARGVNNKDGSTTCGKLHLIDLAGSERVGKTDATGDRLKEAQNINRSLSALGDVINSLGSKKSSHVPYRNSKLTFLLQDSLGGNSKVMMFVNISPALYNVNESICSLNFAFRCRNVELGQAKKQVGTSKDGSSSSNGSSSSGSGSGSSTGARGSGSGNGSASSSSTVRKASTVKRASSTSAAGLLRK